MQLLLKMKKPLKRGLPVVKRIVAAAALVANAEVYAAVPT